MTRVTIETVAGEKRSYVIGNTLWGWSIDDSSKNGWLSITPIEKEEIVMYNTKYLRSITINKIGSEYVG